MEVLKGPRGSLVGADPPQLMEASWGCHGGGPRDPWPCLSPSQLAQEHTEEPWGGPGVQWGVPGVPWWGSRMSLAMLTPLQLAQV